MWRELEALLVLYPQVFLMPRLLKCLCRLPNPGKEMMMDQSPKSEKAGTEMRRNSLRAGSFRRSSVNTLLKRYPSDVNLENELELKLSRIVILPLPFP